eukprot:symbB.v1.2.036007.t3/scaffold4983.1/size32112/1
MMGACRSPRQKSAVKENEDGDDCCDYLVQRRFQTTCLGLHDRCPRCQDHPRSRWVSSYYPWLLKVGYWLKAKQRSRMSSSGSDTREKHAQQLKKTQMCKFFASGRCGKGADCCFAHYRSEIRERPDLNRTSMCKAFLTHGNCTNRHCTFAHDERELRATEGFFKTKLCKFADSGRCKHGKSCRFAHSAEELGPQRVELREQAPSLRAAPRMPASFVTPESSPLSAMSAVPDPFFGEAVQVLQALQALQGLQGHITRPWMLGMDQTRTTRNGRSAEGATDGQ